MKLLFLSKYPPIQGGISAKTYWLSQGLARKGHNVHVVSDAAFCDPTYLIPGGDSPTQQGLVVHQVKNDVPWHVPDSRHRDMLLLENALAVIKEHDIAVIDAGYLIPYGMIAYLAHVFTGIPYLIRHGGSDIAKFVQQGFFENLVSRVLGSASLILTDKTHASFFRKWNVAIEVQEPYVPNDREFRPTARERDTEEIVLAYIGKVNHYWQHKGLKRIVRIAQELQGRVTHRFVCQGDGHRSFQNHVRALGLSDVRWETFKPPWQMPQLLEQINGLYDFVIDLPYRSFSNLRAEAEACGTRIITDVDDDQFGVLCVPGADPEAAAQLIWKECQTSSKQIGSGAVQRFSAYVSENEQCYRAICRG